MRQHKPALSDESFVGIRTLRPETEGIIEAFCRRYLILNPYEYLKHGKRGAVVYGFLRGSDKVIEHCKRASLPYVYIDHAYCGDTRNYRVGKDQQQYRVTLNAMQNAHACAGDLKRWESVFWPAEKMRGARATWREPRGASILLVPPSDHTIRFEGCARWVGDVTRELRKHTDRKIEVRERTSKITLDNELKKAHCVVTYHSTAAVKAVLMGYPAIWTAPGSIGAQFSTDLSRVEDPYFDREKFFAHLAVSQFTLPEIESGVAHKILKEQFGHVKGIHWL